jgi:hypothetical protein
MTTTSHEIDWTDSSVTASEGRRKLERFKGKQGKTHRVAVLTDKPVRTFDHFKKGYGYFKCPKQFGQECLACQAGDRPNEKFATNILLYPDNAAPGAPWDSNQSVVLLWQCGPKVFADIREIVRNWGPLSGYDLSVTCTNEQYQHLNVTPTPKLLWREHPNAAEIAATIEANQFDLGRLLEHPESEEEIRMIWTTNITRDQLFERRKRLREAAEGGSPAAAAAPNGAPYNFIPPASPAPAALPNFSALLGTQPGAR